MKYHGMSRARDDKLHKNTWPFRAGGYTQGLHRQTVKVFVAGVQHCHCTVKNEVRSVAGNPDF